MARPLALALALASGAGVTAGCVGALGLDEEKRDVVSELCACDEAGAALGSAEACRLVLRPRLETAPPHVRAAWMEVFDANCSAGCSPACWDAVSKMPPACTAGGDECLRIDCQDCCNGASVTQPGSCAE